MARPFEMTGGNIRNIALPAAFLATEDGRCVQMRDGEGNYGSEFGKYAGLAQAVS